MDLHEAVVRVQSAFPCIYLACHSRHQNTRTTPQHLSQRDATLLAHLSELQAVSQSDLAEHLGVAKSTLSEALSGLEEFGFVARRINGDDSRCALIVRTAAGTGAMSSASVLEPERLGCVLERLTVEERHRVIEGFELLAGAILQTKEHV